MQKAGLVACGLVLVWAAYVMLEDVGKAPLQVYDEGTYAKVVAESIERGDFITFTLHERLWFEKPPLYFWLAGVATYMTGSDILGIRLPAALFGVATVAMTMLLAHAATKNIWAAVFAGTILVATEPFVQGAREARLDLLVVFFILLGFWAAFGGRYSLFAVSAGLAVMSKSAVGLFVFVPLLFALPPLSALWLPALVFLLIVLPWHLWEWARWGNAFWYEYVGYHVLERYQSNIFGSPNLQTDYVSRLSEQAKPLLTVVALALLCAPFFITKLRTYELRWWLGSAATLGAMLLVFFSAETRALSYLLPLYPFAALLAALCLHHVAATVHKFRA